MISKTRSVTHACVVSQANDCHKVTQLTMSLTCGLTHLTQPDAVDASPWVDVTHATRGSIRPRVRRDPASVPVKILVGVGL